MTCGICKKKIKDGARYWRAIRADGKRVLICEECTSDMTQVDPEDAPPFPSQTWDKESN